MQLPPSKRNAPPERPQVAPIWLILLLAGLVGSALWVLYPRDDLEVRLHKTDGNLDLTESYVRNLLRSEPDNAELRDMLNRIVKAKALRQAESTPPSEASQANQAAWNAWEADYQKFQQTPAADTATRDALRASAVAHQQALDLQALDESQLLYAGQAAMAMGDAALAKRNFDALLQRPDTANESTQILEVAAKSALGQGLYDEAAQWYVDASRQATADAQKKVYLLGAIGVLQAGNRTQAALELAEKELAPYRNDPAMLRKLVDIARAAGKPDVAQIYAKQLLKLSLQQQFEPQVDAVHIAQQQFFWDDKGPQRHPAARLVATNRAGPQLPFDDKTYELGYTVFLENRNQEDAWRVARAAVQQAPTNLTWRRRLADVAEWTQRPGEALAQWHYIALQTNDHTAWQHVLRLAPGQLDDRALVDAMQYQLRQTPEDSRLLREIVATYERLGEPNQAIAMLQRHANRHPAYAEALAILYERSGQDQQALQQWDKLLQNPKNLTPSRAIHASVLALRLGQGNKGLAWLRSASKLPFTNNEEQTEFLRMHAEVADLQNATQEAEAAYAALLKSNVAAAEDFDSFIELLRQQKKDREAASVARTAWERLHNPQHLIQAMSLYAGLQDWHSVAPLVDQIHTELPPEKLLQLKQDPSFYSLLGNFYQGSGQADKARAAYAAGLKAFPESADMRQASLWLAIDSNDADSLKLLLQHNEAEWKLNPALHDTLAAAYQALSLPQVALSHYLHPRVDEHRGDFLWMMGYADALDQNQQSDLAWQVRQRLLKERSQHPTVTAATVASWLQEESGETARRLARTRLLMTQRPGDMGTSAMREMLRLDADASKPKALSQAATDTLIGWYLDAAQYPAVRSHLWERYARSRSQNQPLWAEISVALAEENRLEAGQLLEQYGDVLPRYDRVAAAVLVGDIRRAQTDAFAAQDLQPDDDPLHQQLTESLLASSDHAGFLHNARSLNELTEQSTTARLHWALTPQWSADLNAESTQRRSRDNSALVAPSDEKGVDVYLRWKGLLSNSSIRAGQRESLDTYHPLQLQWEQRWGSRLRWRAELGRELPSTETTMLRLGGMKQRAGAGISYSLTRQDTFSLDHFRDQFRLQTGAKIGSGNTTTLQYTHNLRSETPSLEIGVFWSAYRYSERNLQGLQGKNLSILRYLPNPRPSAMPADVLLPRNFNYAGISLSTNQRYSEEYTRAVQPFGSISLTQHSRDGAGYGATVGVAGSVLGNDHLMLGINFSKSSPQAKGSTRELQFSYRKHF